MIDDRTANLNLPKPNAANRMDQDVERLRDFCDGVDTHLAAQGAALVGKAEKTDLSAYQTLAARNAANGYAGLNPAGQIDAVALPFPVQPLSGRNAANGYAGLDAGGHISEAALPFASQPLSARNAANGYAGLDAGGHISEAALPPSVPGRLLYKGPWSAKTSLPALPAQSAGIAGWFYVLSDSSGVWGRGDWMVSDGASWIRIANPSILPGKRKLITSGTTYQVPDNCPRILVECVGGGGGGSRGGGNRGGGGGGYASKIIEATPGTVCTIGIGAGGIPAGGNGWSGGDGGRTWFSWPGGLVEAYGASGGCNGGGFGGSVDIGVWGEWGSSGFEQSGLCHAAAGGSPWLYGHGCRSMTWSGPMGAGSGAGFGAGGGGSNSPYSPGAGTQGAIIITEYY